mmetsp:Transcript_105228/g.255458  ORF Transcript_105228/g.255458 Transcript_105228/m.255458 type:complete len:215 (+) Transcript_105228:105-749(+)
MAYTSEDFSSSQNFQEEQTLTLKHPVEHGIVVDWDDMAKTWHHAVYNERRAAPDECPALQAEAPLDCKSTCERMTQLKREMLVASAMHAAIQAVLFLDVLRDIMGIVMDSGGGFANFAEGYVLLYVIPCVDLAGCGVMDDPMRNLTERCCVLQWLQESFWVISKRRLLDSDLLPHGIHRCVAPCFDRCETPGFLRRLLLASGGIAKYGPAPRGH